MKYKGYMFVFIELATLNSLVWKMIVGRRPNIHKNKSILASPFYSGYSAFTRSKLTALASSGVSLI